MPADLIQSIQRHIPHDAEEAAHQAALISLLTGTSQCFLRSDFPGELPGHITGSGLLVSPDGTQILMTHHKFLNRWLQFGGHADGDTNVLNVALRESEEESGITGITPVFTQIFDIDVHQIPENPKKGEPAHYHYDLRYLLRAPTTNFVTSDESHSLKWFTLEELDAMDFPPSVTRLFDKYRAMLLLDRIPAYA